MASNFIDMARFCLNTWTVATSNNITSFVVLSFFRANISAALDMSMVVAVLRHVCLVFLNLHYECKQLTVEQKLLVGRSGDILQSINKQLSK